jgi:hypothetical protein
MAHAKKTNVKFPTAPSEHEYVVTTVRLELSHDEAVAVARAVKELSQTEKPFANYAWDVLVAMRKAGVGLV